MVTMLFWLQCFVGDCSPDTECFIVLLYQGERYMFIVYRLHLFHSFYLFIYFFQFLLTHLNIYLCVACWNRHYVSVADCKNMISMIPEFVLLCQIWFRNKKCSGIFYHFSMQRWHRWLRSFFMEDEDPFILHTQDHGCWCPGGSRSQGINSPNIDLVNPEYSSLYRIANILQKDTNLTTIWSHPHHFHWNSLSSSSSFVD